MINYLLINDNENVVIITDQPSLPGFRHFGKYVKGNQISCFTGKVLSTIKEDVKMLTELCSLTLIK